MLDMAFQLLTFFVFTYRPSSFEGLIDLALPSAAEAKASKAADVKPSETDLPLDLPVQVTVMIRSGVNRQEQGKPTGYVVMDDIAQSDLLHDLPELAKYLHSLHQKMAAGMKDDQLIEATIKADGFLRFEHVVDVMDVCTAPDKGGFRRVNFALARPKSALPAR